MKGFQVVLDVVQLARILCCGFVKRAHCVVACSKGLSRTLWKSRKVEGDVRSNTLKATRGAGGRAGGWGKGGT